MPQRKLLNIVSTSVGLLTVSLIVLSLKLYEKTAQNKLLKDKISVENSIHKNQISELLKRYDSVNVKTDPVLPLERQFSGSSIATSVLNRKRKPTKGFEKNSPVSGINAVNVNARGVRLIGKDVIETNDADKIDQVRIRFSLEKNNHIESGVKKMIIQIMNPKGRLISFNDSNGNLNESLAKEVYCDRLGTDVCVFVDLYQHQLIMGDYKIKLICDGNSIGSANFKVN